MYSYRIMIGRETLFMDYHALLSGFDGLQGLGIVVTDIELSDVEGLGLQCSD